MLNLARQLFWRYAARHRVASRAGGMLRDASGRLLAEATEVTIHEGRVQVRVRAAPEGCRLLDATGFATPLTADAAGNGWLSASVPAHWGALRLAASDGASAALPMPATGTTLGAVAMAPGFALGLLRLAPQGLRWLKTRDPLMKQAMMEALGLADRQPGLLDGRVFGPGGAGRARGDSAVTIILPVHNAFDLLPETIARIEANTDLPWHLIVIEDASTDRRVRPWLHGRAAALQDRATLIENADNLGFIGSVNLGFARALELGDPVVLLNSDAFVPPGWASRLVAPLADATVASVTPMSNDAELTTVPVIAVPQVLEPGDGDALDRVASGLAADAAEMPTGVGFCMAIAPGWLAKVPRFDPAFGRGYGEEVDWCRKVAALGGRHLGLPGLFVEHRGAASFGAAGKQAAIARGNALVADRHPRFFDEVRAFVDADPLLTPRLALGIALASRRADGGLPLYVGHAMGGGAEIWLQRRVAADLAGGVTALVLRVGGVYRWKLELHLRDTPVQAGVTGDLDTLRAILASVPRLDLRYSCAVGDPDPFGLPLALLALLRPQDGAEMFFHDYLPLSPSYTLLDSAGRFRGVPDAKDSDPAHQGRRRDGTPVTLAEWRGAWGALATRSERLVTFSADSAAHVAAAWPELAPHIKVRPHILHTPVPRCDPPGHPFNVAVLGNINRHKGLDLLATLARLLAATPDAPGLLVIGKTDPDIPLPHSVHVHGPYAVEEIDILARRHAVGAWLVPSICPETFSYTTHEALATGLPVIGLDLGAQGDALRRHENGVVVPVGEPDAMVQGLLQAILKLGRGTTAREA